MSRLPTTMTSPCTSQLRAWTPQMWSITLIASRHWRLLRWETPSHLRLRPSIGFLPLLDYGRDPDDPPTFCCWPCWDSTLAFILSITRVLSTIAAKSLMESGATISLISPRSPFSNFLHRHSSSSGIEASQVLEPLGVLVY